MKRLFRNPIFWIAVSAVAGVTAISRGMLLDSRAQAEPMHAYREPSGLACQDTVVYRNDDYGFEVTLPEDWKDYTVLYDEWKGVEVQTGELAETGPFLSLRSPKWAEKKPTQDIPIYVFTPEQWDEVQREELSVSAAPIGPSELGRNEKYVFALPARYNFAFPEGWEEVDEILNNGAVRTFDSGN